MASSIKKVVLIWSCLFSIFAFQQTILAGNSTINAVAQDSENKLVAGGFIDTGNGLAFLIMRYNADGTLDSSFNADGVNPGIVTTSITDADAVINDITIDQNNNIIAAGYSQVDRSVNPVILRYTSNGVIDETFSATGLSAGIVESELNLISSNAEATSVTLDNQNRIVVTGNYLTGSEKSILVFRFLENGLLDESFNENGNILRISGNSVTIDSEEITPGILVIDVSLVDERVSKVIIDRSNRIVLGGSVFFDGVLSLLVCRINDIGNLDEAFNPNGVLAPLGPGRTPPGIVITQVNPMLNQTTAANIGLSSVTPAELHDIVLDGDNNIVGGGYYSIGGVTIALVARYTDDGLLDTTFSPAGSLVDEQGGEVQGGLFNFSYSNIANQIHKIAIDSFNRIVGTGFTFVDQIGSQFLTLRILSSGVLDHGFSGLYQDQPTSGFVITSIQANELLQAQLTTDEARALLLDNANRIVVAGLSNDSVSQNATLIRYMPNGTLDSTFNSQGVQPGVVITRVPIGPVLNPLLIGAPLEEVYEPLFFPPEVVSRIAYEYQGFRTPSINLPTTITTNQTEVPLQGTAHPNSLVTIVVNNIPFETVLSSPQGQWSARLPELVEGDYNIEVISTDIISKLEVGSNIINMRIDTLKPDKPRITSPRTNTFTNQSPTIISGTAGVGTIITLLLNGTELEKKVKTNKSRDWRFVLPGLRDNKYEVYAYAQDQAGNISEESDVIIFVKDTKEAIRPIILRPQQEQVVMSSKVTLRGKAKPFTQVTILLNKKSIGTAAVNKEGIWLHELDHLSEGKYIVQVQAVDPISKRTLSSVPHQFSVNLKVPELVEVRGGSDYSVSSVNSANNLISQQANTIAGRAAPGSTIELLIGNKYKATTQASKNGIWSYTLNKPLQAGSHTIQVFINDNNTGKKTQQQVVITII